MSFDKALLDNLTDEERAAIMDGEPTQAAAAPPPQPADGAAALPQAGAATDEGDDDSDDDAGGPPIEGAAAAPAPAPTAQQAAPAPAPEPAPAPAPAPAPTPVAAVSPVAYSFKLPDDYQARVTAAKEKESALWAKFDEGELSREDLQRELGTLADERESLRAMQMKADLAADMQQQAAQQTREQAVAALFERAAKPEAGGIDYRKDRGKMAQLDSFVKALAADDANEDKPLQWFLDEAHKRVLVLNGIAAGAPAPSADPAKAKADALAARKPDLSGADATLAHVPGGQGTGDVGGEFDDVLALEGEAFEDAINEMARRNPQRFARFQAANKL
jgi:hypothetical protein